MPKFDGGENGVLARKYTNYKIKELVRKSIHLCAALVPSLLSVARLPVLLRAVRRADFLLYRRIFAYEGNFGFYRIGDNRNRFT